MRKLTKAVSMLAFAAILSTPSRLSAQAVAIAQIHGAASDAEPRKLLILKTKQFRSEPDEPTEPKQPAIVYKCT